MTSKEEKQNIQIEYASQIEKNNSSTLTFNPETLEDLNLIGGLDISFKSNDDDSVACVTLVILEFPSLKLVSTCSKITKATVPYEYSYLGFREIPLYDEVLRDIKIKPQILLIDGNGIYHPRGCGSASQLSLVYNIPTIGVTKKFMFMENLRNEKGEYFRQKEINKIWEKNFSKTNMPLKTTNNETIAMMINCFSLQKSQKKQKEYKYGCSPIYVSIGNKIDLETSVKIVKACSRFVNPEPIRKADLISRSILRDFL